MPDRLTVILPPVLSAEAKEHRAIRLCRGGSLTEDDGWGDGFILDYGNGWGNGFGDGINSYCAPGLANGEGSGDGWGWDQGHAGVYGWSNGDGRSRTHD
jgi:hypothetical protein